MPTLEQMAPLVGGGGSTVEDNVNQVGHGFAIGNPIYKDNSVTPAVWKLAGAIADHALAHAVVVSVTDADNFRWSKLGQYSAPAHGFPPNEYQYLAATLGEVSSDPAALYKQAVFFAINADTLRIECGAAEAVGLRRVLPPVIESVTELSAAALCYYVDDIAQATCVNQSTVTVAYTGGVEPLSFNWTVDAGAVVTAGQGTRTATFETDSRTDDTVTATCTITDAIGTEVAQSLQVLHDREPWLYSSLGTPVMNYDAQVTASITTDGSNNVTAWADQSGNARDLDSAAPPSYDGAINGTTVPYFAGTENMQFFDNTLLFSQPTLSGVVVKPKAGGGYTIYESRRSDQRNLVGTSGGNYIYQSNSLRADGSFTDDKPAAVSTLFESTGLGGQNKVESDARAETIAGSGGQRMDYGIAVGARYNLTANFWVGDIGEIVIFNGKSGGYTDLDRRMLAEYLAWKWGILT